MLGKQSKSKSRRKGRSQCHRQRKDTDDGRSETAGNHDKIKSLKPAHIKN